MSNLIILDTRISIDKEFKLALRAIFGFSYIKLRHLNKIFGTNTRYIYLMKDLNFFARDAIPFYLPDLAIFGGDLSNKISLERNKFLSLKCYKRNRYFLGLPVNGQRTHTNAKTAKKLRLKF